MKNKEATNHLHASPQKPCNRTLVASRAGGMFVACMAVACVLLCLVSWVVGFYIDDVNGLLTKNGIRWLVNNLMPNFMNTPLGKIIYALLAASVVWDSGILNTLSHRISLKQKRALEITGVTLMLCLLLLVSLLVLPGSTLLSAFGTVSNSPLQKGWFGLAGILALVVGNVYGYTSGRFVHFPDFVQAHTSLFASVTPYFITLFFSCQFIAILQYSNLLYLVGNERLILSILTPILYYVPLLLYIVFAPRR